MVCMYNPDSKKCDFVKHITMTITPPFVNKIMHQSHFYNHGFDKEVNLSVPLLLKE